MKNNNLLSMEILNEFKELVVNEGWYSIDLYKDMALNFENEKEILSYINLSKKRNFPETNIVKSFIEFAKEEIKKPMVVKEKKNSPESPAQRIIDSVDESDFEQEESSDNEDLEIISVNDLIKMEIPEFPYVVDTLVPEIAITAITADTGKGKSLIANELARCVASGESFLGEFKTKQGNVLIIDQEMNKYTIAERARNIINGYTPLDYMCEQFWKIDDIEKYLKLKIKIIQNDYKLIIFDTFVTIHSGEENSAGDMREINTLLLKLIKETGVTIIFIHHHRKQGKDQQYNQSTSRGSTEITAKVSSLLLVDSKRIINEEGKKVLQMTISQEKSRGKDWISKIGVNIIQVSDDKTEFEYIGEVDDKNTSTSVAVDFVTEKLSRDYSKYSIKSLVDIAKTKNPDIKEGAIRSACRKLCAEKIIQKEKGEGKFWNTDYHFIVPPDCI